MYLEVLLVTLTFRLFGQEVTELLIEVTVKFLLLINIIYKILMVRKRWINQIKDYRDPYMSCDLHFLYVFNFMQNTSYF